VSVAVGQHVTISDRYDEHGGKQGVVVEVVEPVEDETVSEVWRPDDPRLDDPAPNHEVVGPIDEGDRASRVHVRVTRSQNPAYPNGCAAVDVGDGDPVWIALEDLT
jgi:hypothetical protein